MKYAVRSILILLATIFIISCTSSKKTLTKPTKQVLCTVSMIADLVKAVAQDKVNVSTLIKEDLDPHTYELVKGDDERLCSADLIFYNGLGLEHSPNIKLHLEEHPNSHSIGNYIQNRYPELILSTNHQIDPHIWMDVSVWEKGVPLIVEELCQFMPENADFFREKGLQLQQEMKKTHFEILKLMQEIPASKRYLITCHDAFYYFARGYLASDDEKKSDTWRTRFIAPEGLAPDSQLSTADIQKVISFIQKNQVTIIFPEYNVNLDSIYKIKEASTKSGLKVEISQEALYGDTMAQNTKKQNYLQMMLHNAETIHQQLKENQSL